MNFPTIVVIVFLQQFLFLLSIVVTNSQRTNARQGVTSKSSPTVTIPGQGTIVGKEILLARPQKVTAYLGIPYARPPVGSKRFAAPVTDPPVSWEGQRNATKFRPSCLHVTGMMKYYEKLYRNLLPTDMEDPGVSEDCLYLNIYVPDEQPTDEGWPVMVWFHGGDFNTGTPAIWDATIFVYKEKVLVVTVAYRLNIFGFFTTTDAEAPGNYGMLDQVAALDWIQKNIKLFGGSPKNVVISGHNAGAMSVGLHIVSPLSKGKFSKAIAMSGDSIELVKKPELEVPVMKEIAVIFDHCNFKPTSAFMECLRSIPAHILLNRTAHIETWGPIVDQDTNNSSAPFLPKHPRAILEEEDFNAVPFFTGYTSNEPSLSYFDENRQNDGKLSADKFESKITDEIIGSINYNIPFDNTSNCEPKYDMVTEAVLFFYKPYPSTSDPVILRNKYLALLTEKNYASSIIYLASKVSTKAPVFVYRFDYRAITPYVVRDIPEWAGVPHMFELPFVWGLPHMFGSNIPWSGSDKNLADLMMLMIGQFIKTGNSSVPYVKWDPFTEESPGILPINRTISKSDVNAIDHRMLAFWNVYYPRLIEESSSNCCNTTNAAVTNIEINWDLSITSNVIVMIIINLFYV